MLRVTVLGCGSSMGVPSLLHGWGHCDPKEPRNRRRRPALLIEADAARLLVDPGPDLRAQLLELEDPCPDAVFVTHSHADHCHGIDELRAVARRKQAAIPIHAAPEHMSVLQSRFPYMFRETGQGLYPPFLEPRPAKDVFCIGDQTVRIWPQDHVVATSYGLRIGRFAYVTDAWQLDEEAFDALAGITHWIVAAVQREPHPTHAHLDRALDWIARVGPDRAIFTHMNERLDYHALRRELPAGVEPAYDGMIVEVP